MELGGMAATERMSFGRRITELASAEPDRPAVTCGPDCLTRSGLESAANRLARELDVLGVRPGSMVTIALPNSTDFMVAMVAAWKLGAIPQPVSARLPGPELSAVVDLADPAVVVGVEPGTLGARRCLAAGHVPPDNLDDTPLPDAVSPAWKAPTSGGSTGLPKLIVSGDPGILDPTGPPPLLFEPDGCLVMPGPLYHNGPLTWSCQALLWGGHVVILPRFDAEATLAAIDEHRADVVYLVPTMMKRIWRLPAETRNHYDLASLRVVWHLAEPCPAWLKEAWIGWLGPDRIVELYGGTEGQVTTVISGREWLEHRGSVGRPLNGDIMICDAAGGQLGPGEEGEVWLRGNRSTPSYRYIGAQARSRDGGWESLGDNGWLDEQGYLYLGDRVQDMILTGGANVYPAEVEAAVVEHPGVHSCAVIGLPDDDKGSVIHAIVESDAGGVTAAELHAFVAERLVSYKVPRTFEFTDVALRDDAGKVRRGALRDQRLAGGSPDGSAPIGRM